MCPLVPCGTPASVRSFSARSRRCAEAMPPSHLYCLAVEALVTAEEKCRSLEIMSTLKSPAISGRGSSLHTHIDIGSCSPALFTLLSKPSCSLLLFSLRADTYTKYIHSTCNPEGARTHADNSAQTSVITETFLQTYS